MTDWDNGNGGMWEPNTCINVLKWDKVYAVSLKQTKYFKLVIVKTLKSTLEIRKIKQNPIKLNYSLNKFWSTKPVYFLNEQS